MLENDLYTLHDRDAAPPLSERALALCHDAVSHRSRPHAERERIFAELDVLLDRAGDDDIAAILGDRRFGDIRRSLHQVRADYEYQREFVLAEEIIALRSDSPARTFRSADWYEQASGFEMEALAPYRPQRLLFVGAGPFPTSAFSYMRTNHETRVTGLERSEHAGALSVDVARVFGFDDFKVIVDDALGFTNYSDYDCVIVGLVVGTSDAEKSAVVEHLARWVPPTTLLTFRTAVGSGMVIYPSIDLDRLGDAWHRVLPDPPHKSFSMVLVDRSRPAQ